MSIRRTVAALFIAALLVPLAEVGAPATSAQQPCVFLFGFKALHDLIPDIVGDCTTDEQHAANGDGLQFTTRGLMVWRKADNWTAFTDGSTTWINGPEGIASRPNAGPPFDWEAPPAAAPQS